MHCRLFDLETSRSSPSVTTARIAALLFDRPRRTCGPRRHATRSEMRLPLGGVADSNSASRRNVHSRKTARPLGMARRGRAWRAHDRCESLAYQPTCQCSILHARAEFETRNTTRLVARPRRCHRALAAEIDRRATTSPRRDLDFRPAASARKCAVQRRATSQNVTFDSRSSTHREVGDCRPGRPRVTADGGDGLAVRVAPASALSISVTTHVLCRELRFVTNPPCPCITNHVRERHFVCDAHDVDVDLSGAQ